VFNQSLDASFAESQFLAEQFPAHVTISVYELHGFENMDYAKG
jgi:hypothetical protein